MATLLFKVFSLTLKTASKPLAASFERYIMGHPALRTRVISLAQYIHRMDVSLTRGAEGKTGKTFVGDMAEDKAVQLASKVVSEGFLYGTAILLLLLEMDRKSKEETAKSAKSSAEKAHNEALHEQHAKAEEEMRRKQEDIEDLLGRIDERILMMEEQLMDIRQSQVKRRWF